MAESWLSRPYGSFGSAIYDSAEHEWLFQRSSSAFAVRPLNDEDFNASQPSQHHHTQHQSLQSRPGHLRRELQIRDLLKVNPELQPAYDLLPATLRFAEAVEEAVTSHDAMVGANISIGRIWSRHRSIDIIAWASGPEGSNVSIATLSVQRQGWDDDRHSWLATLYPVGDPVVWQGPGVSVQQICFATVMEGIAVAPYIAIRLLDRSIILQIQQQNTLPHIRLEREILISDTGHAQHAHVSFNPWFGRELGVVDCNGSWSMFELIGDARLELKSRSINTVQMPLPSDGWARIAWVGDPSFIAIATRQSIQFHRIRRDATEPVTVELQYRKDMDWILDVVVLLSHPSHLIILTSTHLTIEYVSQDGGDIRCSTRLKLRHHANDNDRTLCLECFGEKDDLVLWIRSRASTYSVAYKVSDLLSTSCTFSGPMLCTSSKDAPTNICSSVPVHLRPSPEPSSTLCRIVNVGQLNFYQVWRLSRAYELTESIWTVGSVPDDVLLTPCEWRIQPLARPDQFVVGDTDSEDDVRSSQDSQSDRASSQEASLSSGDHVRRVSHLTRTARYISRSLDRVDLDVSDIMEQLMSSEAKELEVQFAPIPRLKDLFRDTYRVKDFEHCAERLQQTIGMWQIPTLQQELPISAFEQQKRLTLEPVSVPTSLWPISLSKPNDVHDYIMATWVQPLSSDVERITRLQKAQIASFMTAELLLAGHVLRHTPVLENETAESQTDSAQHQFELPFRDWPSSPTQGISEGMTALTLPITPSPTATPSIMTNTSLQSSYDAPAQYALTRYTTFSKSLPSALSEPVQMTLRHWEVGTDPMQYDWRAVDSQLQKEAEEDRQNATLDDHEKKKLERRKERHLKKQRRAAEESQKQLSVHSQLPTLAVSASQPALIRGTRSQGQPLNEAPESDLPSSQGPAVIASQVLQGPHGGRQAKKKRKRGF